MPPWGRGACGSLKGHLLPAGLLWAAPPTAACLPPALTRGLVWSGRWYVYPSPSPPPPITSLQLAPFPGALKAPSCRLGASAQVLAGLGQEGPWAGGGAAEGTASRCRQLIPAHPRSEALTFPGCARRRPPPERDI